MWEKPWKDIENSEKYPTPLSFKLVEDRLTELGVEIPWAGRGGWRRDGPRIVQTSCEKCGSSERMVCFYADSGDPNSFYDNFFHACLLC